MYDTTHSSQLLTNTKTIKLCVSSWGHF